MNEDKELEEAIQELQEKIKALNTHIKNYEKSDCKTNIYLQLVKEKNAIKTVLQALENSIPKKKIEDKILQEWKKCPKNSINDFAIVERNNKIQVLQELLEDKEEIDKC